jgi:hypothetical protein
VRQVTLKEKAKKSFTLEKIEIPKDDVHYDKERLKVPVHVLISPELKKDSEKKSLVSSKALPV